MGAVDRVREWRARVREELLPDLHAHQSNALADVSFAFVAAGSCQSGPAAVHLPGKARPASNRRRIERIIANPRLDPRTVFSRIRRRVADGLARAPLILILDETFNGVGMACMKLSIAYRRRAVPIAAVCYYRDRPPRSMPRLIIDLLHQAAASLPAWADVTLLTDRGLSWPKILDAAVALGWRYVGRIQGSTRVTTRDGRELSAIELVQKPGRSWNARARAFKKAGGRDVYVTAVWERGCREAWLLVSDRLRGYRAVRRYAKRFWTEELFRDEKSHGLRWRRSRIVEPSHADRLVAVMALATLLAVSLGTWVLKSGRRSFLESRRRRTLSVFQIGLRWLQCVIHQDRAMPASLYLYPS